MATIPSRSQTNSAAPERAPPALRLQRLTGPGPEQFTLARRVNILGRGEECQDAGVHLEHPGISRRHAIIEHVGGTWFVGDLGSVNGTYLNGEALSGDQRMPLAHGDSVRFAFFVYRVDLGAGTGTDVATLDDAASAPAHVQRAVQHGSSRLQEVLGGIIAASAAIHSAPDEAALWKTLLSAAIQMTGYERGAILRQPGASPGASSVEVCASLDPRAGANGFAFSRTLVRAAMEGEAVFLRTDDRPAGSGTIEQLKITTAACIPLLLDGAVWGVLYLDSRMRTGAGTTGAWTHASIDDACRALGQIGSLALSHVLRRQMQHRLTSLQRDAELAAQAQHLLLPPPQGRIGNMEYALRFRPGMSVSGDLVGIARLDDTRSAAFLGDVTGKGLGPGLVMATIQGYLTASLLRHRDAAMAMDDLNRHLAQRLPPGCFASLWLCVLDSASGTLTAVDAGHGSALIVGDEGACPLSAAGGPWLGAVPEMKYQSSTTTLEPHQRLVVMSDGLLEQPGKDDLEFGIARAQRALAGATSVSDDVESLLQAVQEFAGTEGYRDDLTLLSLAQAQDPLV